MPTPSSRDGNMNFEYDITDVRPRHPDHSPARKPPTGTALAVAFLLFLTTVGIYVGFLFAMNSVPEEEFDKDAQEFAGLLVIGGGALCLFVGGWVATLVDHVIRGK